MHEQAYTILTNKLALGESKYESKLKGTTDDKIFSISTYHTYKKHINYFLDWVKEIYPSCTTIRRAREYVPEWLQTRVTQGLSAWTVQVEAKALGKLYDIKPTDDDYFVPPKRQRIDIKRSRTNAIRDRNFSTTNNAELITFCRGTGLRRHELQNLKGTDLLTKNEIFNTLTTLEKHPFQELTDHEKKMLPLYKDAIAFDSNFFIYVASGKGGKSRISPIIGTSAEINQIVNRFQSTAPNKKVWQHVHSAADIHGYRSDYATAIYSYYARQINDIPYDRINHGTGAKYQSDVYVCRKDEKGKKLDRHAMLLASKALGHNRVHVVASNYLRNL